MTNQMGTYSLLFSSFYIMFFVGMFMVLRGLLLPEVKEEFTITHTASGLVFLVFFIPSLFGNLFSGYLFSKYNEKVIFLISSLVLSASILALPHSKSYGLFLFFVFTSGFGISIVVTGGNIAVTEFFEQKKPGMKSTAVNVLHLLFSFGGVLPLIFIIYFSFQVDDWKLSFLYLGLSSIIILFGFILSRYPHSNTKQKENFNFQKYINVMKSPQMIRYLLVTTLYAGGEVGLTSWLPTFFEMGYKEDKNYSSYTLMFFFILFTLGRFIGTFTMGRLKPVKLVILLLFIVSLSVAFGIIYRVQFFHLDIFLVLSGFLISVLFPIFQNYMAADFKEDISVATSIFYAGTSVGVTVLLFFIGWMNDLVGAKYGILLSPVYLLLIIPVFIPISKRSLYSQHDKKPMVEL